MMVDAGLDTTELRSFVVLAEQRHFGRAADLLSITQPALTKRLQRLEEKVGGPLLLRRHRAFEMTEAGRVLLERARLLLREAELALQVSRGALRGEAGLLRIGFGVATIARILPRVLLRFQGSHPLVRIDMRDMSSPAQLEALRAEEIDLGFVRMPVSEGGFESVPILHERLVAAIGEASRWRPRMGLASLANEPFVVCPRSLSASYYDHVIALCRVAGFAPRIATETNELFSLLQLVRAGAGVALVPSAAADMRVPGVRFRDVGRPEAAWDIALAWRRGAQRSALIQAFVQEARDVYAAGPSTGMVSERRRRRRLPARTRRVSQSGLR